MKSILKRTVAVCILAAVLVSAFALSSCGAKLVSRDGVFYCAKNKVTYKEVNYQYQPVALQKEAYAELQDSTGKTELFALDGVAPEKWLSTSDGRLFCAIDENVPDIEEMAVDSVYICKDGTNMSVAIAEITKKESVDAVIRNILSGSELDYPTIGEAEEMLSLRLTSSKYPWLYYSVSYVEFEEDVKVIDNVEDISTYVYRQVDESVTVTTVFEYECWYLTSSTDELNSIIDIAQSADIAYGTVTMPDGSGGNLEYVGLYFYECNSLEECVEKVIENYKGSLSKDRIHTMLDYPDMEEKINVVEYNYGKYLVYDRSMGKCVKADILIHEYKELIRND